MGTSPSQDAVRGMATGPAGREWLTVEELADELRVPMATVYAWRTRNQGPPAARIGRYLRFRRDLVDAWVAAQMDGVA